jgi:uncharacterized membrane protein
MTQFIRLTGAALLNLSISKMIGAILIKFGLAPTTQMTLSDLFINQEHSLAMNTVT